MGGKWAAVEGSWRPVGAGGAGWRGLDGGWMSVGGLVEGGWWANEGRVECRFVNYVSHVCYTVQVHVIYCTMYIVEGLQELTPQIYSDCS